MADWKICCRCGQPNESERTYCWVCYRALAEPATLGDYRKLLGVTAEDTDETIKHAYRRLAVKYHPDKNPIKTSVAEEQFKLINRAYEALSSVKWTPLSAMPTAASAPSSTDSSVDFESILGDFGFASQSTLLKRQSVRRGIVVLIAIGIAITALELIKALISFFSTSPGSGPG